MDPEALADALLAALDASLAKGMDPDVKAFSVEFNDAGDASIKSTSGAGKAFELVVTAAEMAEALDAELDDAMPAPDAAPIGEVAA